MREMRRRDRDKLIEDLEDQLVNAPLKLNVAQHKKALIFFANPMLMFNVDFEEQPWEAGASLLH